VGAATALPHHLLIDVADRHSGLAAPCARHLHDAKGNVAVSARHIHRPPAGLGLEPFHHRILPDAVDTAAHQVVHQVVTCRDGGKHLADKAFFFGLRHVTETEAGGIAVTHAGNIARGHAYGLAWLMPELPEVETVRL